MAEDKHPVFKAADVVADGIINTFFKVCDPIFAEQIKEKKPEEAKASNPPTMPPECREVFDLEEDEEEVTERQVEAVSEIGRAHCSRIPTMAARPPKSRKKKDKKDKAAKKKANRNRRKNR